MSGNISVDESMMNGESKEVYKEANSLVYMNTVVYSGDATILVKKVGDNTFYGKMMGELSGEDEESVLKTRLTKLAQLISKIGYICSIVVAFSYLFYMIIISNNFNIDLILDDIKLIIVY